MCKLLGILGLISLFTGSEILAMLAESAMVNTISLADIYTQVNRSRQLVEQQGKSLHHCIQLPSHDIATSLLPQATQYSIIPEPVSYCIPTLMQCSYNP